MWSHGQFKQDATKGRCCLRVRQVHHAKNGLGIIRLTMLPGPRLAVDRLHSRDSLLAHSCYFKEYLEESSDMRRSRSVDILLRSASMRGRRLHGHA